MQDKESEVVGPSEDDQLDDDIDIMDDELAPENQEQIEETTTNEAPPESSMTTEDGLIAYLDPDEATMKAVVAKVNQVIDCCNQG